MSLENKQTNKNLTQNQTPKTPNKKTKKIFMETVATDFIS